MNNVFSLGTILTGYAGTYALSTAATYLAIGFVAPASKTISSVALYCYAISTPGAVALEIWSNTDSGANVGQPNAALSTAVTLNPAVGWNTWTGVNQAVTAGTRYHIVAKGPASGSATIAFLTGSSSEVLGDHSKKWDTGKWQSTDSGATWGTAGGQVTGFIITFSDGSTLSLPYSSGGYGDNTAPGVEGGVEIVIPDPLRLNIRGLTFHTNQVNGTPTGDLQYRIYRDKSLVASTLTMPVGIATGYGKAPLFFSEPLELSHGTYQLTYRNTVDESAAYRVNVFSNLPTGDAIALRPFGARMIKFNVSTGTITYTDTGMPYFSLLIDIEKPGLFDPLNRRNSMLMR